MKPVPRPESHVQDEFVVCMAMDAFRLCIGRKPKHHSLDDVIRWMRIVDRLPTPTQGG